MASALEYAVWPGDLMDTKDQADPFWSERLYVRIPRRDIALFKFFLEGYENLALLSVLDRYEAVARLRFSPDQVQEVRQVLDGMKQEIELTLLDLPPREARSTAVSSMNSTSPFFGKHTLAADGGFRLASSPARAGSVHVWPTTKPPAES